MNKIKNLFSILLIVFVLSSCGSDKNNNANFLPPLDIEIPAELVGNKEVVALLEASEDACNEFSNNIETLIVKNKDIWNKTNEELSMMEQITLAKTMAQFALNSSKMIPVMEKLNNLEGQDFFDNLNEEQIQAFQNISKVFTKRLDEINAKYEKLAK